MAALPPWPAENHVCAECSVAYLDIAAADVPDQLRLAAAEVRALVSATPAPRQAQRSGGAGWSMREYLCHLRDVHEVSTIRLYRARTELGPQLEPMYNDLRSVRFRYAERDAAGVLDELDAAVAGCCDELARVVDWQRTVVRRPGEERTALWLARNAVHEARHHLHDLRTLRGSA